ncbi:cytochrome P450 family protein [Streptomyces sp. BI20]|uniref:cytochrome P450 family protein n=1 Tax=Streptomyces sp. BI20 TaxID=3403460 RepID=UPI003C72632B
MNRIDFGSAPQTFFADPYPTYAQLAAEGPVHPVGSVDGTRQWLVIGHEEARAALTDPAFVKAPPGDYHAGAPATASNRNLLELDPPHHTRLRRLVSGVFTTRRVEALRPRIEKITGELLDDLARNPERRDDLVARFAFPLPMTVICELLGVPDLDRDRFRTWSQAAVDPRDAEHHHQTLVEMTAYLGALIAEKSEAPGEDLLSDLIRTRDEDGDRLSPDELVGMAFLLLVAGHETTVNLIANGTRALLTHPEQLAAVRADPEGLLPAAIEEVLRWDGPVENATYRWVDRDLEFGGVSMSAGDSVLVSLAGSDRDGDRWEDPEVFDVHRPARPHLAFGHGIHFCVGAPLARLEARIAFTALLERFPGLALDPDGPPLTWITGSLIRGTTTLPVRW